MSVIDILYRVTIQCYPKRLSSFVIAHLVRAEKPRIALHAFLALFARVFHVNVKELPQPLNTFRNFQDFFSRELPASARPLGEGLVSPVDGALLGSGPVQSACLTVKGSRYTMAELVSPLSLGVDPERTVDAGHNVGDSFFHFYLSPRDYHRIHVPFDCTLRRVGVYGGEILPVGERALRVFPRLLARNTRWVFDLEGDDFRCLLSAVAALHVASFYCPHLAEPLAAPAGTAPESIVVPESGEYSIRECSVSLRKGEELGRFLMGSSVVLFVHPKDCSVLSHAKPRVAGPVRFGESLFIYPEEYNA